MEKNMSKFYDYTVPGFYPNEIDQTTLPDIIDGDPNLVIGRSEKGPMMIPTLLTAPEDLEKIFGIPVPGGKGVDIWRNGNTLGTTYGAYAAYAMLNRGQPVIFVRLGGFEDPNRSEAGMAGWNTTYDTFTEVSETKATNGGAYGLFVANSGTGDLGDFVLASVFYVDNGALTLSGTWFGGDTVREGASSIIESDGANFEFTMKVYDADFSDVTGTLVTGNVIDTVRFNFSKSSNNYIRKVFNTNPTLVNSEIVDADSSLPYWLGESFDNYINSVFTGSTAAGEQVAVLMKLSNSIGEGSDFRFPAQKARSGWVFSQDLSSDYASYDPDNMQKLFRFWCIGEGEWGQHIKVSIDNLRYSSNPNDLYGYFDVLIRNAFDSDKAPIILEKFPGCTLDPSSDNYVGKKIGTKYFEWDENKQRIVAYGKYRNKSNYIRVEMNEAVDRGTTNEVLLPFGFYGEPKFQNVDFELAGTSSSETFSGFDFVRGGADVFPFGGSNDIDASGTTVVTGTFVFPQNILRTTSKDEEVYNYKNAYWGVRTSVYGGYKSEHSFLDVNNPRSLMAYGLEGSDTDSGMTYSYKFSLDNVAYERPTGGATRTNSSIYATDEHVSGTSINSGYTQDAVGGEVRLSPDYRRVIDAGFARFTMCMYGGFDGLDIKESEPFRNTRLDDNSSLESDNYVVYSIKRALQIVRDPDYYRYKTLMVNGVTEPSINNEIVSLANSRKDCIAFLDIAGDYVSEHESKLSFSDRIGDVDTFVSNIQDYNYDTSYASTCYNWVQIADDNTGKLTYVPSSVVTAGVCANVDSARVMGTAPAGYNNANLTERMCGLNVVGVAQELDREDKSKLYSNSSNYIDSNADGIALIGQKTLLNKESKLNRIANRRTMIYLKSRVRDVAKYILFKENINRTWNEFVTKVDPFLREAKKDGAIEDYKLILDKSTTTEDLADRNIIYGKCFIKPVGFAEFFPFDFILTNNTSVFAD